jgi:hypothetical protein
LAKLIDTEYWQWIPCISIGPFKIGTSIFDYIKKEGLIEVEEYRKKLWNTECNSNFYLSEDENAFLIPKYDFSFIIYTEKNLITYFLVETYLYYNNCDIIWKPLAEVMKIIGRSSWDDEDSQEVEDRIQQMYYFYDIGLILWTFEDKVESACCNDGTLWVKE